MVQALPAWLALAVLLAPSQLILPVSDRPHDERSSNSTEWTLTVYGPVRDQAVPVSILLEPYFTDPRDPAGPLIGESAFLLDSEYLVAVTPSPKPGLKAFRIVSARSHVCSRYPVRCRKGDLEGLLVYVIISGKIMLAKFEVE